MVEGLQQFARCAVIHGGSLFDANVFSSGVLWFLVGAAFMSWRRP